MVPRAALRRGELGRGRGRECPPRRAGAEAADLHVDVAAERADELGDVHARPSVDLGRVFAGEQVDAHAATLARGIDAPSTHRPHAASA